MNSLRTDSQQQQHGHVPNEIFNQGAQTMTASSGHQIVGTKKSSSYKQGIMVQQRTGALQKRIFGDELTKQIVHPHQHHQAAPQQMQMQTNQYVLHPISSAQASEQTRASSEGHQTMNKSFDFAGNQSQLNNLKVKHMAKRNGSGQVCNIENTNPNTIMMQQQKHGPSSGTGADVNKYQHLVHYTGDSSRCIEAPKIIGNNSNLNAPAASPFTSGSHAMHAHQQQQPRMSGAGNHHHDKLLRPLHTEQQSRFVPANSRPDQATRIQKRSQHQPSVTSGGASKQLNTRVNTYHSQHNQLLNNSQRLSAFANNAAATRINSVGAVSQTTKSVIQAHAYDHHRGSGGGHASQPIQTVTAQQAAANTIKSMNMQKRKAAQDHPKKLNRTAIEETKTLHGVKERSQETRHVSLVDPSTLEVRRDSSQGANGIPSSRNFKPTQVLKKMIGTVANTKQRGDLQKSHQNSIVENLSVPSAPVSQQPSIRTTELIQLSASTTKHTSKAVKLSDSQTHSIGKLTDKDKLQSSIKRHAETPARVKILRFHNNLKKGGLFEQRVNLEDRDTYFDPQSVAEFVGHIYHHCLADEEQTMPDTEYMNHQKDINQSMREILIDWLIEVHLKFGLLQETLFLTVNLIDRFLSTTSVNRNKLQLVGVTAMLIASKYEEIYPPIVSDFVYITDNAYTKEEILAMEEHMLMALQFGIHYTSPNRFLERFCYLKNASETEKYFALFMLEGSLIQHSMMKYRPSVLAASALYMASKLCFSKEPWSNRMASITTLQEKTLRKCSQEIYKDVLLRNIDEQSKLCAVFNKYSSSSKYGGASIKIQQRLQQKESLASASTSKRTKAYAVERESTASKGQQKRHSSMTNPSIKSQALATGNKQTNSNSFGPHKQQTKPIQIIQPDSISTAQDSHKRQQASSSVPASKQHPQQLGSFDNRISVRSPKPIANFLNSVKPPTVLSNREQTQTIVSQSTSLKQLVPKVAQQASNPRAQKATRSISSQKSAAMGKESEIPSSRYKKLHPCLQRSRGGDAASNGHDSATHLSQDALDGGSRSGLPSARTNGGSMSSVLKAAIRTTSIPGKQGFGQ